MMAEVSYLHLHEDDDDHENDDFLISLSPRSHDWSQDLDGFDDSPSDLDFPSSEYFLCRRRRRSDQNPIRVLNGNNASSRFDRENEVNFVIDMFHSRVEQSHSSSRVIVENDLVESDRSVRISDWNEDVDLNDLEVDFESGLGLGLGLEFPVEVCGCNDEGDENSGFMVADCGDEFLVSRSESRDPAYFMSGLSVTDSDEDHENEIIGVDDDFCDDEASLRLCWDAFQLEDDDDDHVRCDVPAHQQFEWEEVDGGGVNEREVLTMFLDAEADNYATADDREWEVFLNSHNLEPNPTNQESNNYNSVDDLEWEVFLNVHNLEANTDLAGEFDNYNDEEHEMLFGQFANNGDSGLVRPPASKKAVESLVSVVMTLEHVENNNTLCAVCKDEIGVGGKAKQLPCTHHYHEDCIVPWLCIRNTCPVCRHELPTDDPDYERRKAERVASEL